MSHVFLATEASLNRQVVIKVLPPEMVSEVSSARFKREMEVTAQLHHPHILPVLTAGARDDVMYYVMPFVAGESLRHRMAKDGRLPIGDALRILREVADALAFAHEHGVVHRDIKPENILLEHGHAVLADFGVARALMSAGRDQLTGTGMSVGTPGYMAPEQLTGERNIDARSDVYALALVGYEMMAGHPPFKGDSATALITAHLMTPPVPLIEVRPDVPPAASNAIARALSKNPDDRFQTAGAFRDALDAAVVGAAVAAAGRSAPSRARRWLTLGVAAVAVLAVVAGGLFYRGRGQRELDANMLVVAPFNVLSPDLALWKEGLVDVLTRNLDGAGPLRTVSPSVTVQGWSGHADRQTAGTLARRTGAGLAIFGTLEKFGGDSVRAALTLMDANTGALLGDFQKSEHAQRMDRLVDSLTIRILRELGRTRPTGGVRLAGVGSNSLPALKAFLEGETFFRRSVFDSALTSYDRAVALDSGFALALYRAGTVRGWFGGIMDTGGTRLIARAAGHLQGVAPRESLIIVMDSLRQSVTLASENVQRDPGAPGRVRRLFEIADLLAQRYPLDPDVWNAIGEARYHHGTSFGRRQSRRSILEAFDRAIAADSGFVPAYVHGIEMAFELGSVEDGRRYLAAATARASDNWFGSGALLVQRMLDPALAKDPETLRVLAAAPSEVIQAGLFLVELAVDSGHVAVAMFQEAAKRDGGFRYGLTREGATGMATAILGYRGRVRESREFLLRRPGTGLKSPWASYMVGEAAYFDLWPDDTLRAVMKQMPDTSVMNRASLAITAGDSAGMKSFRPILATRADSGDPAAKEMVAAIDAFSALRRADTAAALSALRNVAAGSDDDPLGRVLKAELLLATGRPTEALDVVRDGYMCRCATRVMMSLLRGRAAEAAGEKDVAIESYALVSHAWSRADPELQHVVKQARDGLERLGADRATPMKLK